MSPAAAIARLETLSLDPGEFHHKEHIQMAWNYLQEYPLATAIARYAAAINAFATHVGHPEKYHETITWAYMLVVNERMRASSSPSWEAFSKANPDLFVWPKGALGRYYTEETLKSERARVTFLMPDRLSP